MPGRIYRSPGGSGGRYGFNGKENDNEVKGVEGGQQDYGMRIYDPRLGRFLSVDPITRYYASLSPYPFAMNRPIDGVDLDGKEWTSSTTVSIDPNGIAIVETVFTITIRIVNQSSTLNSEEHTKSIAQNIAARIEQDFRFSKVDLTDNSEIQSYRTNVILDFTPLKEGEVPNTENGFWMILEDQTTQTRINDSGDEETYRVAGRAVLGETQHNLIRVGITQDGRPVHSETYARTASHEVGHTGDLPHPWNYQENNQRGLYDVQTYREHTDRNGRTSLRINGDTRRQARDNMMNSDGNPEISERNNRSRKLTETQFGVIKRKVETQQEKKQL